jgi:Protein of unknown function (DUF2934)
MVFIPEILHFGPSYPEEILYFSGRITYEDCGYLCKLHGRYAIKEVELVTNREQQVRNMAYYLWKNNGGDSEDNWLEAEKAQFKYEHNQLINFANGRMELIIDQSGKFEIYEENDEC